MKAILNQLAMIVVVILIASPSYAKTRAREVNPPEIQKIIDDARNQFTGDTTAIISLTWLRFFRDCSG